MHVADNGIGGKAGFWSNFNLMMYKVWLEKIRRPISFLLEIVELEFHFDF